jgi:hypothetical protein
LKTPTPTYQGPLPVGAAFALGAVEVTPDGGRALATAEVLLDIAGAPVIVSDAQIIRWPGGRYELRTPPLFHPRLGWIGAAQLPDALGDAIAIEALARINAEAARA